MAETEQPLGLRERKKQRTRQHIADTARRLFAERGFEAVTVMEIAREAEVAPATVFNYFPTKEDLFYSRLEEFEDALLDAIRQRPAGKSILAAFSDFLLGQHGILALDSPDPEVTERVRTVTRIVVESPALMARERQVLDRYAQTLAALIAEEIRAKPGDVLPSVTANVLLGLHRALIEHVRRLALDGEPPPRIGASVRRQIRRAVRQLEHGLGDFAVRAPR